MYVCVYMAITVVGWLVVCLVWLDGEDRALTVHTDMLCVARAMSHPDSGLEIRDRLWLKITIPRAFIG